MSSHRPRPTGASLLVQPAIAASCASAIDGVVSDPDVAGRLAVAAVQGPELLRRFAGICDGRSDQGIANARPLAPPPEPITDPDHPPT